MWGQEFKISQSFIAMILSIVLLIHSHQICKIELKRYLTSPHIKKPVSTAKLLPKLTGDSFMKVLWLQTLQNCAKAICFTLANMGLMEAKRHYYYIINNIRTTQTVDSIEATKWSHKYDATKPLKAWAVQTSFQLKHTTGQRFLKPNKANISGPIMARHFEFRCLRQVPGQEQHSQQRLRNGNITSVSSSKIL